MDSQTTAQDKEACFKYVLPFWKYCLLIVATGGLYEFYWFFRVWTFIKAQNKASGL